MLCAGICTKTELPADPPLMAYASALLILFASMRTQKLHIVQTGWKAAVRAVGRAGGMGGAFKQSYHQTTDHHSSGTNQLWEALCQHAWIQESLWANWSVFTSGLGKYDLLLWSPRGFLELYSRIVKGLETCYKAAVNTFCGNVQC